MKTTMVPIDQVIPYARNPRKNAAAVDKVAASIKEFGWRQPIVINEENVVVVGHTRLMAAQKLGITEVPVHVADLTDSQAKAYRLADNRVAEYATWDDELLGLEIRELDDMEFDLDLVGFEDKELAGLLLDSRFGTTEEDEVPEPPADPVTQPGDLITLGEHRVLCGDATERRSYRELLGTVKPALVVSDPPYGVAYKDAGGDRIQGDLTQAAFPISIACVVEAIDDNARVYFFCGNDQIAMVDRVFNHHLGLRPRINVWKKEAFVLRRVGYHSQFEFCAYGWKGSGGGMDFWYGDRKQSDIWDVARDPDRVHPTQKPVAVCCIPIVNSSSERDAVLDPFLGSGTTLIAAEQLGRKCYGMELSPAYCDVIVQRWENLTGGKAERGN